jgi:hypothetical protein
MIVAIGKMSTFGGPYDTGVKPDEGLALVEPGDLDEWWFHRIFLSIQPTQTTGLARRLNPNAFYIAMRWGDYGINRDAARRGVFRVTNIGTNKSVYAQGADSGPAEWTNRIVDVSPGIADALNLETDDEVIVELI